MTNRKVFYLLLPLLSLALSGCGDRNGKALHQPPVKKKSDIDASAEWLLKKILETEKENQPLFLDGDTLLTSPFFLPIYRNLKHCFFFKRGMLTPLGDSLLKLITNLRTYGLIPQNYHRQVIESYISKIYNRKDSTWDVNAIIQAELQMQNAYFLIGAHLNKGRFFPDSTLLEWNPNKLDSNWSELLFKGLSTAQLPLFLDSLEPHCYPYKTLKQEMNLFIHRNLHKDWNSITFSNIEDTTIFLQNLKQRLIATSDYDSIRKGSDSLKLARGIKSFQKRMNLAPDGKLGKFTRQALGLSKEMMIRQMEMNLERWRWEKRKFPKLYVLINIPSAEAFVFEWAKKKKCDTLVLRSNVVVGKPETPTPILDSKINYLTIYPYWKVPFSIAWKEILPMLQRDTAYLRRNNFEVMGAHSKVVDARKIKWKKYNKTNLPYAFRQRIGADNSLGILEFNFNNKFGVYMHDTKSKIYFKTLYRFQSHGCIRLEKYEAMAKTIIRDDTLRIPYDSLNSWLSHTEQKKVSLRKTIPIFIRYFSTTADSNGLHQYLDIYRKDEKMIQMLYPKEKT